MHAADRAGAAGCDGALAISASLPTIIASPVTSWRNLCFSPFTTY